MIKKCKCCGETKPATLEFFKHNKPRKDGTRSLSATCRECLNAKERARYENPETKAKIRKTQSKYEKLPHVKARKCKEQKQRRQCPEWKARRAAKIRERRASDPLFRTIDIIRRRIRGAIKGYKKGGTTEQLLGCSHQDLMTHLESQFTDGMAWENQGEWHIDHIIPLNFYDMSCPKEQYLANHYSNLQPLWAKDNLSKGAKLDWSKDG